MKKALLFLFLLFAFSNLIAQQENIQNNTPNFFEIQEDFESYCEENGIVDGYYYENGQKQKAAGWKQFKRWEWYWENRITPETGEFPSTSASEELAKMNTINGFSGSASNKSPSGNWISKGPSASNSGYSGLGRINCIAFHPTNSSKFYVGSPSGGIWVTTNGGTSWTVLSDNNSVLGVSDIIVVSQTSGPDILYIATGDRDGGSVHSLGGSHLNDNHSIGILKSTDGGSTWQTTGLTWTASQKRTVNRLLKDPSNNNIIYAATSAGLYKTTNAGTSWSMIYSTEFIDMEFKPGTASTIYASTLNGDIFRTINSGTSFSMVLSTSNYRVELAVSPANSNVVYAVVHRPSSPRAYIYKSTNSGASFSTVFTGSANLLGYYCLGSATSSQGNYDLCIAADPNNANIVYVGGVNTWKSTNGGSSWTNNNMWTGSSSYNSCGSPVVHADKHNLAFQNGTSTMFECNDGGVYKTSNGGTSWTDLTNGMAITQIYRLGVAQSTANETILGTQDNGSKAYVSGSWNDVLGGDGFESAFDPTNANTMYAEVYYGDLYKSTDHGLNWNSIAPTTSQNAAWCTPYQIDPNNSNTIFMGYEEVFKSTNGGTSWSTISSFSGTSTLRSLTVAPSNSSYIYAADRDDIYKTTNGGISWSNITGSLPVSSAYITYISVKHNDPNTIWVSMGNYNSYGVYQSTNGGTSWANISSGLPSIPIMCVIQNKQATGTELYAATDVGVYVKSGTNNWIPFNTGLPNVLVTELEIYYHPTIPTNSKLRAATYGRGLWESDLLGTGGSSSLLDCTGAIAMSCGGTYSGTTVGGNSNVSLYSCATWNESGPEKVHTVTTSSTGNITAAISNLSVDLDVFILSACDENACVAHDDNTATYTNAPAGTYYIVVDGYNGASGSYTLNLSCQGGGTGTPDLHLTWGSLNITGNTVDVDIRVKNSGTGAAGAFDMGFYVSTDQTITTSDYFIGSASATQLAANDSVVLSLIQDVCLLSGIPNGTYTVGAIADYQNTVTESDETNNEGYFPSPQLVLSCSATTSCQCVQGTNQYPSSTLTPTITSQTVACQYAGEYSQYNVVNGETYLWSYCTSDGGSASDDRVLNLFDGSGNYIKCNDDSCTNDPAIVWTATYTGTARVKTTEKTSASNLCATNSTCGDLAYMKIVQPQPDLHFTSGTLSISSNTVTASVMVKNSGTGNAASFGVGFYVSTDQTITTSDYFIGSQTVSSLIAGDSSNVSLIQDVCLIGGIPNGTYTVGVIADYLGVIAESDETNNEGYYNSPTLSLSCTGTQYTVSTSSNPTSSGITTGDGTYSPNASVTVGATANTGYSFNNWTESSTVVSSNASYTFNIIANRVLVANFNPLSYTVSVSANPTIGGTVSGGGSYNYNQSATVLASANAGYVFDNWTDNGTIVSTSSSYTFIVSSNTTLVANFSTITYNVNLSANPSSGGSVSGGGSYQPNQSATVLATANSGYNFDNWTENGTIVSTSSSYTFTVIGNRTLVANFSTQSYLITTTANPTTGGIVSGGGSYAMNSSATVIATPNSGWTFLSWTDGATVVSTSASYTFTVNADRILVATFTPAQYLVGVNPLPSTAGMVSGGGTFAYNQQVTVSATPNVGWNFDDWSEGGTIVSTSSSYTFNVTANRILDANFSAQKYSVSITADPAIGGNYFGAGSYLPNANVTITASPYNNYVFEKWTENGSQLSTSSSYSFTINSDRTFIAHFLDASSIDDPTIKSLELFPNPANDNVFVKGFLPGQELKVGLYSIDGKLIRSNTMKVDELLEVSVDELANGMYMMVIQEKEIRYNLRFVKD